MRGFVFVVVAAVAAGRLEGQLVDRGTIGMMPASVEAAERELVVWFNLVKSIAFDPIAQQHGTAIVRFVTLQVIGR